MQTQEISRKTAQLRTELGAIQQKIQTAVDTMTKLSSELGVEAKSEVIEAEMIKTEATITKLSSQLDEVLTKIESLQ